MRRIELMNAKLLAITMLSAMPATGSRAALLELEWAGHPGDRFHTMAVGETATINIRLDLIAGESWGWAEVPLGAGTWWEPDDTSQFEITSYAPDGYIGPGFTYDRSGLPSLPFSPEDYMLITEWDGATPIQGPATVYLDSLEIEALAVGHDDIVFGESFPFGEYPPTTLVGADGGQWNWRSGYEQSQTPGDWTEGVGDPGVYPLTKTPEQAPLPLRLNIIPEPRTLAMIISGVAILTVVRALKARDSAAPGEEFT